MRIAARVTFGCLVRKYTFGCLVRKYTFGCPVRIYTIGCVVRVFTIGCLGVLLCIRAAVAQSYTPPPSPRIEQTINAEWTFTYTPHAELDERFAAPGFDDRGWPAIALPHTWSTYETTGDVHPFIKYPSEKDDPYWWHGWGWYRKRFSIGEAARGRRVSLEFDGVQKYSLVYLNGRFIGEHKGGYTSFSFDVTDAVRFGTENVLAVAVSNRRDDPFGGIPPMTAGNFNVYGGIYRDVRVVLKNPVHIPYQGSADQEGGTFVTTPQVDSTQATVRVQAWVRNTTSRAARVEVKHTIVDPEGQIVSTLREERPVGAGALERFDATSAPIRHPRLWSPETPTVYSVWTEVRAGGKLVDAWKSPLGFRWYRWDYATNKLWLNGKPVWIRGTNRHQEYPWLGDAVPKWIHRNEMQEIRRMGHNFMRTVHYPQDPMVYNLADSLGIITVEEVPNIKNIDFGEDIQAQNVREMVRRDRNHPSILFWSVGNETDDWADPAWVLREDTTRIVHLRHPAGPGAQGYKGHTNENLEMENQLQVTLRGWYDDEVKPLRPENGQHAGNEAWQHYRAGTHLNDRARIDEDIVVWLYADHGADREYKDAPLKHVNAKGWVDLYRIPKYVYYRGLANWTDRPVMFIHPYAWRRENVGQKKSIVVDANTEYVELKVNGRSLGRKTPGREDFFAVTFDDVPVEEGTLVAEGTKGGVRVADTLVMAGSPVRLVLTASSREVPAGRAGIATLTVDAVDARGAHVYGAKPELTWKISGPGRLLAPEHYATDIDKHEEMEGVGYIDLPVGSVLRSGEAPGEITVTVSAPGLEPASLRIRSVAPPRNARATITEPVLKDAGRSPVARDAKVRSGAPEGGPSEHEKDAQQIIK